MTPVERIERLVRAGTVTAEEGARLLAAVEPGHARATVWGWLFRPFERIGGERAVAIGAGVCAASLLLARSGVHFDGAFDMHPMEPALSLGVAASEQAVSWILAALVFWAYARAVTRHVRVVDFIGFVGVARAPFVLGAAVWLALVPRNLTPAWLAEHKLRVTLVAWGLIPFLVWFGLLLYRGFKNASGLAGPKLGVGFAGVLVIAEAASKLALHLLR